MLQVEARLQDEGLAVEAVVQLLPEHGRLLTNRLVDGGLVGDARRPRRSLEVEHAVQRLPGPHAAVALEDGACRLEVAVLDERGEEELIHGG